MPDKWIMLSKHSEKWKKTKYNQAILQHRQKMNIPKKHRKHYQYMPVGLGPAIIECQASESE